jgi:hypothetical protein
MRNKYYQDDPIDIKTALEVTELGSKKCVKHENLDALQQDNATQKTCQKGFAFITQTRSKNRSSSCMEPHLFLLKRHLAK